MTLEECPLFDGSTDLGTVESEQCSCHTEVGIVLEIIRTFTMLPNKWHLSRDNSCVLSIVG